MANPYDNPEFAKEYAVAQADAKRNRYEWEVTHPALLQFLDSNTEKIVDYGCGGGIFTAIMNEFARTHEELSPQIESIGADASPEILHYAELLGQKVTGVTFQEWNANLTDSDLQDGKADRVFAKLVFNYISPHDLYDTVMPRLHSCLNDKGLLVAVLPNPLREVGYSESRYVSTDTLDINVGNFGDKVSTQSYHHTHNNILRAADNAGFAYGNILGLPEVRFEPYKKWPWSNEAFMKIAHPMPLVLDTLNAAKRWVYVFGATQKSADAFDDAATRFSDWRAHYFPEIADRAHMLLPDDYVDSDVRLPVNNPRKKALYDYVNSDDPTNRRVVTLSGVYAEHLTPAQKIKTIKTLAQKNIRPESAAEDHLITL
jgi:trans-aconitate methyltransferase